LIIQQNSVNLTPREADGPDYPIFQIIGDTYSDLSYCRYFFVIAPIPGLCNKSEQFSTWIYPVSAG
jgi:hypothetical protein